MARTTAVASALAGLVLAAALAGCVPTTPTPVPTQTGSASATPSASPTPAAPAMVEGGTAKENQPYFDQLNNTYFSANGIGTSAGVVENLAAAGFRKQDMQVTAERTSIDLQADSMIVSVRLKGECLIGDFQPSSGYRSAITPLLGTGGCLIGTTVPIQ